jgi:hypothetical protein
VCPYRGIPIFKPTTIVQHYLRPEEMMPFHKQVLAAIATAAAVGRDGGVEQAAEGVETKAGNQTAADVSGMGGSDPEAGKELVEDPDCAREGVEEGAASLLASGVSSRALQGASFGVPEMASAEGAGRDKKAERNGAESHELPVQHQRRSSMVSDEAGQVASGGGPADELYAVLVGMGLLRR